MGDKITFFKSYYEAIKGLPAELQVEIYTAIFEYAFNDELPDLTPVAGAIFKLIAPVLKKSRQIQDARQENGSKGGRPKTNQEEETTNQEETEKNQTETKQKPKQNQTETKKNQTETKTTETETETEANETEPKHIGIRNKEKGIRNKEIGIGNKEIGKGKRNKEKEIIKGPDGLPDLLTRSGLSLEILPAVSDYIEMRKKIKAPLTDRAVDLMLTNLAIMSKDPAEQIQILNQSIMNSWKGLFPLKQEQKTKNKAAEELDAFYKMAAGWAAESEGAS